MAVLKDLIVHGPSRFLNGINVDAVHANLIDADNGVFKTITTTTLDAETITTDMLNATNARVSQTLTVDGTISTNKWEAANIANIGGNFYISPTGKADSGTITITKTGSTTINGIAVGVYTLVVGSTSFGVTSTSSTIWGPTSGNQSKVIFTGSIAYSNSKKYPLGTCNGTMTALSVGTNTLTGFTITGVNSPALDIFFKEVGVTSISNIACSGYEMQISVYQSYSNSALRPIGILLTSYGKEKRQYIDIYNGENQLGDSSTGFADPAVRIGLLDGLSNIVDNGGSDTLPGGWGIYTTNGFFKGKIVANAGKIATWNIGSNAIFSGTDSKASATPGTYLGTDALRNYNSQTQYVHIENGKITAFGAEIKGALTATSLSTGTKTASNTGNGTYIDSNGNIYVGNGSTNNFTVTSAGAITAASGTIGGWSINSSYGIYTNSKTSATSTNTGILIQKNGNIYAGTYDSTVGITSCPFQVTNEGVLTARSGTIGGFEINNTSLHTKNVAVSSNSSGSIALSSEDFTREINNTVRENLRFASGDKFGVTSDGTIYASRAFLKGTIRTSSLEVSTEDDIYIQFINDGNFSSGQIGASNQINNNNVLLIGTNLQTSSDNSIIVGQYNQYNSGPFTVGTGTSNENRKNAFAVNSQGDVEINSFCRQVYMIGEIRMFCSNTIPDGWLICDGTVLVESEYPELVNVLGTTYGSRGQLPDLRGRAPLGAGSNSANTVTTYGSCAASTINRSLGEKGGEVAHKLLTGEAAQKAVSTNNMSANSTHDHEIEYNVVYRASTSSTSGTGVRNVVSGGSSKTSTLSANIQHTHSITGSDATTAHNNIQPYTVVNFIIYAGVHTSNKYLLMSKTVTGRTDYPPAPTDANVASYYPYATPGQGARENQTMSWGIAYIDGICYYADIMDSTYYGEKDGADYTEWRLYAYTHYGTSYKSGWASIVSSRSGPPNSLFTTVLNNGHTVSNWPTGGSAGSLITNASGTFTNWSTSCVGKKLLIEIVPNSSTYEDQSYSAEIYTPDSSNYSFRTSVRSYKTNNTQNISQVSSYDSYRLSANSYTRLTIYYGCNPNQTNKNLTVNFYAVENTSNS